MILSPSQGPGQRVQAARTNVPDPAAQGTRPLGRLIWEDQSITRQTDGLVLELAWSFDAPAERVFRMLTEPAELAKWWGPYGFTTPDIEVDLRVGAAYRITMQPPAGEPFHLSGKFLEIDAPHRLVYTFRWEEPDPDDRETVVRLSLDAGGVALEVALWQGEFATQPRLELHRSGWTDSFEKLRDLLESGA